jgi:dTDP-4-dehydrorhamnose 3,5-epimerase
MTLPGVVRGPHEHKDQTDIFCFLGPGDFELHLWEPVRLELSDMSDNAYHEVFRVGEYCCPVAVLIPPGVIHAYKNISDKPGFVVNCPNRLYAGPGKRYPVDEIRHEDLGFYKVE